jgi:putative transcriptional regulator
MPGDQTETSVKTFKKHVKDVGKAIKIARQNRGMTQQEMADAIGISAKTASAIEVGRVEPSISQIQAIAACLREPVGYFFGENPSSIASKFEHMSQEMEEIRKLLLAMETQQTSKRRK